MYFLIQVHLVLLSLWVCWKNGAAWPEQLSQASAHLLQKPESKEFDPLIFRVLMVSPAIYRLWAKIRLHHVSGWAEARHLPQMLAGKAGVGS